MTNSWPVEFEEILSGYLEPQNGRRLEDVGDLRVAGLDSLAMVELITQLEDQFGFEFGDDFLTPATFKSPASLWDAVLTHLDADEGPLG